MVSYGTYFLQFGSVGHYHMLRRAPEPLDGRLEGDAVETLEGDLFEDGGNIVDGGGFWWRRAVILNGIVDRGFHDYWRRQSAPLRTNPTKSTSNRENFEFVLSFRSCVVF